MATVRMMQTGMHTPWKKGEVLTVQISEELGDGEYTCETMETFPADLKAQHAAALEARDTSHQAHVADLNQTIETLRRQLQPQPQEEPA